MWLARRIWPGRPGPGQDASGQYVTVRVPGNASYAVGAGRAGASEAGGGQAGPGGSGQNPTLVIVPAAGGPQPPKRRHWYSGIPRWLRWSVLVVIVLAIFRRIAAWAALAVLSGALHLFGINAHLPHVSFGWPWSASGTSTSTTLVGPLVLQKIEGIDKPALGSTTFDFQFTHSVSKPMGILPCWYSATFSAVGHALGHRRPEPGARPGGSRPRSTTC